MSMAHGRPAPIIREINCHDRYYQLFFESRFWTSSSRTFRRSRPSCATAASRGRRERRLTQPAVSMQVRQLERELGLPLLERVGKRTYTTKAGELLLAHAGRAMQELDRGLELIQELRGVVVPGKAPEIARAVVANELDVGIVSLPVRERELSVTALHRDELVAIAPPGRRWPRGRRVNAAELVREPLILFEQGATLRRVIDAWFQRGGAAPALPMELGNTEAIKKLVESGLGLS